MPKQSKKTASRQAQLSGRAKRVRVHGPAGIPTASPAKEVTAPTPDGIAGAAVQPSAQRAFQREPMAEARSKASAGSMRPRGRTAQLRPIETYFIPEMRRIGLASAVVVAILVVLVFVIA